MAMRESLQGTDVFLIGMMGAGKTSVGQALARQLHYRFFDTDVLVSRSAGKSIPQIFADEGEAGFRDWEMRVLQELAAETRSAIATGGGIVLRRQNWGYLQQGVVVWLDAPVELIAERLAGDTTRPLLQAPNPVERLASLLEERRPLYQQADLRVAIEPDCSPDGIATQAIERMASVLKP
ncbi:MAG: shikimate kinase [Cyanobacteria bacterium QS_8_64_29]|nr:MAG: shikimate kinase [Cyanobacteria bacterium QS_8_64_29]